MERAGILEIGFRDAHQAAINVSRFDENVSWQGLALVSFALFALRSWVNLGQRSPASLIPAHMLLDVGEADLSRVNDLVRALPLPEEDIMDDIRSDLPPTAAAKWKRKADQRQALIVTEFVDRPPKRFVGKIEHKDARFNLDLSLKGFGFLGKGLLYYYPAALFALLQHLALLEGMDESSRRRLLRVVHLCCEVLLAGDLGMTNNSAYATAVAGDALGEGSVADLLEERCAMRNLADAWRKQHP